MEMKKKYVVTSKTTGTKSGLGGALFAIAIIFMIASAAWSVTLIKESETLAITILIISFLLGLCLVGIANIIKNIRISQNQKYIIEEVIEAEANKNNKKACEIPQEVVKAELMAVLAALVKDELKKNAVTADDNKVAAFRGAEANVAYTPAYGVSKAHKESEYGAVSDTTKESVYGVAPKQPEVPKQPEAPKQPEEPEHGTVSPQPVTPVTQQKAEAKDEEAVISRPSVEAAISRPSVEAAISRPSVEAAISRPSVEAAISRPSVDEVYSRPVQDDDDEVLGDEVEKRVIGPVSGGSNWVCKLCGRVNPKFVGTCECGNTRINNSTYGSTGSSMINNSQSRVEEALRSTVRLAPKDNISTTPVKEEPKTPNLDFNSDDYDVAAARAAEEAAAAANAKADIPMPASSRVDVSNSTQISETEWRCNVCNRINRNYVGTCACGTSRH